MNEKGPKRTPWWRYSDQPPSARFLWWVRGVILVAWAIVLFLGVPNTVREANRILASRPPGVARSQELRDLVVETVILYVSLIHISEPTRLLSISYAVFCLKKKKRT